MKKILILSTLLCASAHAQDAAAEMAKKLQNPLANIKAVMTDNTIGFNTGTTEDTSFGFQIQPVYAIDFEEQGFTFIPRGVIPILGIEPGTDLPILENGRAGSSKSTWGLGDSIFQAFIAPHSEHKIKWGLGPQLSLPTSTDRRLAGPGWGAGIAGVVTTGITDKLSFAGIVGNHWGFDGGFNTMSIQPMFYYDIEQVPGMVLSYNATIAADWEASSDNRWTVPLGLTLGRTFDLGKGHGLDISGGPYYNVARPDGAADWMFRFGITLIFP
jgi:hypothetical protein